MTGAPLTAAALLAAALATIGIGFTRRLAWFTGLAAAGIALLAVARMLSPSKDLRQCVRQLADY